MNIYFSGIGGVGIGPLAEIARDAGHTIMGSDLTDGLVTEELRAQGITVKIGQDGTFLKSSHALTPLDWFVHTAALPVTHPELVMARQLGIRTAKRDEFLAEFLDSFRDTIKGRAQGFDIFALQGRHECFAQLLRDFLVNQFFVPAGLDKRIEVRRLVAFVKQGNQQGDTALGLRGAGFQQVEKFIVIAQKFSQPFHATPKVCRH